MEFGYRRGVILKRKDILMRFETIKLYEDREDVTLTTYILDDSPEMLAGAYRPAVLICPGGGYINCSDREAEPVALAFAALGYHAFVLRYSTYAEGKDVFPDLSEPLAEKPYIQYPAAIRELGQAVLLLHSHAVEWHIDVEKIILCGFSAGAHNTAMYATKWHTELLREHFGRASEEFRPAAVILGYPLCDYVYMEQKLKSCDSKKADFFHVSNGILMGETAGEEKLIELSPALNVDQWTPPMFLWATAEDELVPVQNTIRMAHALADHGIPFEMHIFEEGPHGLALASQASAGSEYQINSNAAGWVALAGAWLEKRCRITLPELTKMEKEHFVS